MNQIKQLYETVKGKVEARIAQIREDFQEGMFQDQANELFRRVGEAHEREDLYEKRDAYGALWLLNHRRIQATDDPKKIASYKLGMDYSRSQVRVITNKLEATVQ